MGMGGGGGGSSKLGNGSWDGYPHSGLDSLLE